MEGVQEVDHHLARFGAAEGKFPKEWQEFFNTVNELEKGSHGARLAAGRACKNVLSALVWCGDVMAAKSMNHEHAYGDVTNFFKVWAEYANEVGSFSAGGGLKLKGEEIADKIVSSREKMKCTRCPNGNNHVNSMCFVKKKSDFREKHRQQEYERDRSYDNNKGRGGFRGNRERSPVRGRYGHR
jgi:hypothetical protein